jgi:heme-degrading monooxygenase HmoA
MSKPVYTLGVWRVKEGKHQEFVEAWQALGNHFSQLAHPPGVGTLVQSLDDPQQYYSFGPWESLDAIEEMRNDPGTADEIGRLMELCEEGHPGTYRVVATG